MAQVDEQRLMTKIALMYHEQNLRQSEIAARLSLSQASVSRLLKRAEIEGIVRISVNVPQGIYAGLEDALIQRFGLKDAVVVDSAPDDDDDLIQRAIGSAAAVYVESTIQTDQVVGLSSWSATLLAMVDAMHQLPRRTDAQVIQILGGVGNPGVEMYAARILERFARLVRGTTTYLPAPSIVGSEGAMQIILEDPYVQQVTAMFDEVNLALVGIGDVEPSKLLAQSGNNFAPQELETLRNSGAVGDILLQFFDADGNLVNSPLLNRVAAMDLNLLRNAERTIGLAGGPRKFAAIQGALRGRWINILITDRITAEQLLSAS